MSNLPGRIRGSSKTNLAATIGSSKGQALNASAKRYTTDGPKELYGIISTVESVTDANGEKLFLPRVKVKLFSLLNKSSNTGREWPYWLNIADSPDLINGKYEGLQNLSISGARVRVRFSSQTRTEGEVFLNTSSIDIDDYDISEITEYEGVLLGP